MKQRIITLIATTLLAISLSAQQYIPTEDNLKSRAEFENARFGIFIHWGIYSLFGQGEWYMNRGIDRQEYAKSADAFYPHRFNAKQWVSAIKNSGAEYITFTSRHHDGFSMWHTAQSKYNIVDATPYGKDIITQLAKACHKQGLRLHFYYSHLDWSRDDYPMGRTGKNVGKDSLKADWPHYRAFMDAQLTELLTKYGKIGAIWFDGWWDHDSDATPFDWQLYSQYQLIHRLQPTCLVGNNHHSAINAGEDIQIFERDLPGENSAGFVDKAADISHLPLETCQTMNGMWGYKVADQDYKSSTEIIHYLIRTAGIGANLLLNIGPQPNGELPATALQRLKEIGTFMKRYGDTIKGTKAGPIKPNEQFATTQKGDIIFVHILQPTLQSIAIPKSIKIQSITEYTTNKPLQYISTNAGTTITLAQHEDQIDYVVKIRVKE